MRPRSFLPVLLLVPLLLGTGCYDHGPAQKDAAVPAAAGSVTPPSAHIGWIRTELIFGLKRGDGSQITAKEWAGFMEETVTPRFPAGLTVTEGYGQYRTSSGQIIVEPSNIVLILHAPDPATDASIEAVRAAYCRQFQQESVLKVNSIADVSF